jgi:hypothetical protein
VFLKKMLGNVVSGKAERKEQMFLTHEVYE